jgi:hypothetical protein
VALSFNSPLQNTSCSSPPPSWSWAMATPPVLGGPLDQWLGGERELHRRCTPASPSFNRRLELLPTDYRPTAGLVTCRASSAFRK